MVDGERMQVIDPSTEKHMGVHVNVSHNGRLK